MMPLPWQRLNLMLLWLGLWCLCACLVSGSVSFRFDHHRRHGGLTESTGVQDPFAFYSFLRSEGGSSPEEISSALQALTVPLVIGTENDDVELFDILCQYVRWNSFNLFRLLSEKVSFDNRFGLFLQLVAIAAKKDNDNDCRSQDGDNPYLVHLIKTHVSLITRNLKQFWEFMIDEYGSCSSVCIKAAEWLQTGHPDNERMKAYCSFYLLSGLLSKRDESAAKIDALLSSPCIDPNCRINSPVCPNAQIPFVFSLLSCNPKRPAHYYTCFFNNPRVDVNCVISDMVLLSDDLEESEEIKVCPLPLIYHALILLNLDALVHLVFSFRLSIRLVLRYLPCFVFWLLSALQKGRRGGKFQ